MSTLPTLCLSLVKWLETPSMTAHTQTAPAPDIRISHRRTPDGPKKRMISNTPSVAFKAKRGAGAT
jgi:hypothetical protein